MDALGTCTRRGTMCSIEGKTCGRTSSRRLGGANAQTNPRPRLGGARGIHRALCADRDRLTGLRLEAIVGFYSLPVGAVDHAQAPAPVKIRAWRATRSRSWSSRDAGWMDATGAGGSTKVYSRTPSCALCGWPSRPGPGDPGPREEPQARSLYERFVSSPRPSIRSRYYC